MCTNLTLSSAQKRVEEYTATDDHLMSEHREAMDCYDCEAFLQLGIDAFNWLRRADVAVRHAVFNEVHEHEPEFEKALEELFRAWLEPCEHARKWVSLQAEKGYQVSNAQEFEECCAEVKAIVASLDGEAEEMPGPLTRLMDDALREHRDGETAEFF